MSKKIENPRDLMGKSQKEFEDYLASQGYTCRNCGGHMVWSKPGCQSISLPRHGGQVSPGVARSLIKLIMGAAYYQK